MDPVLQKALLYMTDNQQRIEEFMPIRDIAAIVSSYSISPLEFERILLQHSHDLTEDFVRSDVWYTKVIPQIQRERQQNPLLSRWLSWSLSIGPHGDSLLGIRNALIVLRHETGCQRNYCHYNQEGCICSSPVVFAKLES